MGYSQRRLMSIFYLHYFWVTLKKLVSCLICLFVCKNKQRSMVIYITLLTFFFHISCYLVFFIFYLKICHRNYSKLYHTGLPYYCNCSILQLYWNCNSLTRLLRMVIQVVSKSLLLQVISERITLCKYLFYIYGGIFSINSQKHNCLNKCICIFLDITKSSPHWSCNIFQSHYKCMRMPAFHTFIYLVFEYFLFLPV